MSSLPPPTPLALSHSQQVVEHIVREIHASEGWIDFARFMELALYAPGLGYYSAGAAKFGGEGDFVTAPEISSLFGRTLARLIATTLENTGGDILELGAGSGRLALDLLRELDRINQLPDQYRILELSADLRERQHALFQQQAPDLLDRMIWLDTLPTFFRGVVLGNEVLDAMPVHLVNWRQEEIWERGVAFEDGRFIWRDKLMPAGELRTTAERILPGEGYISEISLAVPALIRSIGKILHQGIAFFIDYGFLRDAYYHPQRHCGTLMCHYRHRAHDDPFYLPGLQDITAHVDFTAVAEAASEAGMEVLEITTQARFLIDCGITDLLAEVDPRDTVAYLPLANQVQRLLSPAEMGELFKVAVLEVR
ncbi:MAG: SAM-dependent methyltransferase [Pseudomonadota bacterium]